MTLLMTVIAAMIVTALWHRGGAGDPHCLRPLLAALWGASLMWSVDLVVGLSEEGLAAILLPAPELASEALLGLVVLAAAGLVWGIWRALQVRRPS
ncbi:MAG: hypothetical protein Q4C87_06255 [Actinomycetaceae bacterium]|nr:hypothetical protein [Actinomycetaceae bacterium]